MFKKILIANRGEIAIRVIRACRELDIASAVIYSDIDAGALHVRLADEAYYVGKAPSSESYLRGDLIVDIARKAGADAIHPGYGFLAENWQFAKLVSENGLTFVGPSWQSIKTLGDKLEARKLMMAAGVPTIPGGPASADELSDAKKLAIKCGYPVLVKAVAGGGGKGMRVVEKPDNLANALKQASSEAASAFGDGRVYIEKYIARPRHIEIQVACDAHGNYVYLGERECSIQRRHQKLVEEAPSVLVDDEMRRRMGAVAVNAVRAADYVNVGTVEFLADDDRNFFFLEVNTRLQVEHPVTELVTGIDLVKEQIAIATGRKLSFTQESIRIGGHAIECRICAEDADENFVPSAGEVIVYREPAGPGVRVDSGVRLGSLVPAYYDPLIAKLITYGATREEAIGRMTLALSEYRICGVTTNICFHESVMNHPVFIEGKLSTNFIAECYPEGFQSSPPDGYSSQAVAVAAALYQYYQSRRLRQVSDATGTVKQWQRYGAQQAVRRLDGGHW